MARMNMVQALNSAMDVMLARDPSVVLLGEDIGYFGGVFRVTDGLQKKYGAHRVIDTPIAEGGFTGAAIGMAMAGMRPIVEMMTWNFSFQAADQIIQNAAKLRYFSGGQVSVPLVIRGPNGGGVQLSAQHTHSLEGFYGHFPGLKVVSPVTPADAKGMMLEAIRDFYYATGKKIGMKPAGGIATAKIAIQYLVVLRETLGEDWMNPDMFRLGASRLANDILMQLMKEKTGAYQSLDYFSKD